MSYKEIDLGNGMKEIVSVPDDINKDIKEDIIEETYPTYESFTNEMNVLSVTTAHNRSENLRHGIKQTCISCLILAGIALLFNYLIPICGDVAMKFRNIYALGIPVIIICNTIVHIAADRKEKRYYNETKINIRKKYGLR